MSRYIDADELRSFIKDQYFKCDMPEEWGNGVMWATSQINHYCNKVAPSIDIVFCKECRYFIDNLTEDDTDEAYDACRWDWKRQMPRPDDFCSYGCNSSEKPNNSTISKMEQVEDEQQTELVRVKYHCINCAENGSYKCSKCDGEMYYKYDKDEPQTMLNDGTLVINVEDATKVSRVLVGDDKNRGDLYYPDDGDEPQTDCAWR